MMILWFAIIGILVYVYFNNTAVSFIGKKKPEEILKERLAGGEITLDEYRRLVSALKEDSNEYS